MEPLNKGDKIPIVIVHLLPLRRGQPLNKGQDSHSDSTFVTSEKRTTSLQGTKDPPPTCPLWRGSTVLVYCHSLADLLLLDGNGGLHTDQQFSYAQQNGCSDRRILSSICWICWITHSPLSSSIDTQNAVVKVK